QVFELPVLELCPIAEVQVLGQGIPLPVAGIQDALLPPDTGRAVEVDEMPLGVASHLFQGKVGIQGEGLDTGQGRIVPVDMAPSALYRPDLPVLEVGDRFFEPVTLG